VGGGEDVVIRAARLDTAPVARNTAARRRPGAQGLRFGVSGVPLSSPRPGTVAGIGRVRELGLDVLEMAWVNGVRMSEATAARIALAARENRVELTAHAPYYVNLCGSPAVVARSRRRLLAAARLGARCGARSVCFHAGFYQGRPPAVAWERIRRELERITARLRREEVSIDVRPELTGRRSQVGSLEEVLAWSAAVPGIRPCVDFAHQHARSGAYNTYSEFCAVLQAIRGRLGADSLRRLHVHVSGIEYGPAGERRHLPLRESDLDYRGLLRALHDYQVEGWLVTESPLMERDALMLQRAWRRL
jgi:deoxyribonuclease-4